MKSENEKKPTFKIIGIKTILNDILPSVIKRDNKIYEYRLEICKSCPLFIEYPDGRMRCNPDKQIKHSRKDVLVEGCGCNLNNKLANINKSCPAGKW